MANLQYTSQVNESKNSEATIQRVIQTTAQIHANQTSENTSAEPIPVENMHSRQISIVRRTNAINNSTMNEERPHQPVPTKPLGPPSNVETSSFKSVKSKISTASRGRELRSG